MKTLHVVELFAGVGGFRVGLERAAKKVPGKSYELRWANQWEPASKSTQHAAWTYIESFYRRGKKKPVDYRESFCPEDIWSIVDSDRIDEIGHHELLTGGFPCQDYSVARPLSQAAGIDGKKGVLWWSIYRILEHNQKKGKPVPYLFLENVDRLLKSPASQRGRDFAIMLSSLSHLEYVVEWRVVNAAEYGLPQRRRRTYILAYHKSSAIGKEFLGSKGSFPDTRYIEWVTKKGVHAKALPITDFESSGAFSIAEDPSAITKNFIIEGTEGYVDRNSPFQNAGMMVDLRVHTCKVKAKEQASYVTLGDVVAETSEEEVGERYYVHPDKVAAWKAQKSAHEFERTSKAGHTYMYKEGALPFPDKLDRASRTIITSEGGATPTRFKHVVDITFKKGYVKGRTIGDTTYQYRRLIPEELEALCMFDRGHTKYMYDVKKDETVEVSDVKRAFFMGNALVVGVIEKVGKELLKRVS